VAPAQAPVLLSLLFWQAMPVKVNIANAETPRNRGIISELFIFVIGIVVLGGQALVVKA